MDKSMVRLSPPETMGNSRAMTNKSWPHIFANPAEVWKQNTARATRAFAVPQEEVKKQPSNDNDGGER